MRHLLASFASLGNGDRNYLGRSNWKGLEGVGDDEDFEATADNPVIMMTIVDEKQVGFSLGAADYFTKPVPRMLGTCPGLR